MLAATANGAERADGARPEPAEKPDNAQLLKGASAMLARYMDESRSIPTATSFRTLTVTDARRSPQGRSRRPAGASPSRT